jgi:hypothetical membrane protein
MATSDTLSEKLKSSNALSPTARKAAYLSGFSGAAIIAVASLITAVPYRGQFGERYSFFNHYISELGEIGVSDLAPLFNLGLIAIGLSFAIFVVALALYVRSWAMYVVSGIGLVAAVGVFMVGVFPIGPGQSLARHTVMAATFFLAGLIFMLLFALYILLSRQAPFPKWLAIPSALTALTFLAFLFLPALISAEFAADLFLAGPTGGDRPAFWLPPLLEWLILFAMTGWIIVISSYLYLTNPNDPAGIQAASRA